MGFSIDEATVRKLEFFVKKYGPEAGPKLYRTLQSQAAHAGVSARLRRKIDAMTGKQVQAEPKPQAEPKLPLFPERESESREEQAMAVCFA